MPSIYTHHKFGNEVYKLLDSNASIIISKERTLYNIFNQSFDNFFYNDFYKFWNKKNTNIGSLCHQKNTNLYFKNIINYIIKNNLKKDNELLSYLFGSINHYVLDSIIHPYVFYKTGYYNSENKSSYKYNGLHTKFEFMLDAFFYHSDTNSNYKDYKIYNEILPKYYFGDKFTDAITCIYKETFSLNDVGNILKRTYNCERFIFRYILRDTLYLKKLSYSLFDLCAFNKLKKIKYNRTSLVFDDPSMLNLNRKEWFNPVTKEKYNTSLLELYTEAINHSKELIEMSLDVINNSCSMNCFLKKLGNKSYITGEQLEKNQNLRYFEF